MDHVVAPLDLDHARVVAQLAHDLADELGIDVDRAAPRLPHITLVSYRGLDPVTTAAVLTPAVGALAPFIVRAHGYGVFAGDADSDLSLHVMVVRTRALDELHRRVHRALRDAGARMAGTTDPSAWTPHITLLDRGLTPRLLAGAVEILTCRPHRSWSVPVSSVAVARRGLRRDIETAPVPLGATTTGGR